MRRAAAEILRRVVPAGWPCRHAIGRVAFSMRPVAGPWGGSSAFVDQFGSHLRRLGFEVCYDLRRRVDAIVLVDPRVDARKPFAAAEIAAYRERHPEVRVLHRVNECDQRKGTDFMDRMLAEANRVADYTVFISEWLRDYHAQRWFDTARPHGVIYNGANARVFHPVGGARFRGQGPLRLVTHHWSDNALKGFDEYAEVDRLIAEGALPETELWVIGRWPAHLRWRAARTFAPLSGEALAAALRQCHVYLTASRWEPCGMHHVEGAQCGLPLLYHRDGGGIVEAGRRYGIGFDTDAAAAVREMRAGYEACRERLFDGMPSGDFMCCRYADVVFRMLCAL